MSLKNPDDEYDELVPEGNNFFSKKFNKYKVYLILLIIGIIIGVMLQFFYINPLVSQFQTGTAEDCLNSKQLLNKQIECLSILVPDPRTASEQCASQALIEKSLIIPKDYNEEAA
ncbi:MAG: hypothetical protein WC821_02240 [archaeon]|jgi:hypothetical protein